MKKKLLAAAAIAVLSTAAFAQGAAPVSHPAHAAHASGVAAQTLAPQTAEQKVIALRQQVLQDRADYRAAVRANNPTAATAAQDKQSADMAALRVLRAEANAEAQKRGATPAPQAAPATAR